MKILEKLAHDTYYVDDMYMPNACDCGGDPVHISSIDYSEHVRELIDPYEYQLITLDTDGITIPVDMFNVTRHIDIAMDFYTDFIYDIANYQKCATFTRRAPLVIIIEQM